MTEGRRWTIHRLGYRGGPLSPDSWHMGRVPREMPRRGTEEEVEVMPLTEHEQRVGEHREELTMIALALKNEGIEGCTPEEGVEQLITLLASYRSVNEKAEADYQALREAVDGETREGDCGVCGVPAYCMVEVCPGYTVGEALRELIPWARQAFDGLEYEDEQERAELWERLAGPADEPSVPQRAEAALDAAGFPSPPQEEQP